ncbi:MAG: diacylglycerol/lipid kinase family protein [Gammaproteobacteria bacterium]
MNSDNDNAGCARLIINPFAGRNKGKRHARRLRRRLAASGLAFRASFSRARGDIERQVIEACQQGCGLIVVAGGDGTVHEAVNGVLKAASDTAIALIPMGTGNDFAKALDLPRNWRDACDRVVERIQRGQPRVIDAGRCDDFFFANGVGLGLDAVVTATSERLKWVPGPIAYVLALCSLLVNRIPSTQARIEHDDGVYEGPVSLAVTCNGQYVGGVFHLAPRAKNDDGRFNLVIAEAVNRGQVIRHAPKVLSGTHEDLSIVTTLTTRRVAITVDPPMPVEADGEMRYTSASQLTIELLPAALRIFA